MFFFEKINFCSDEDRRKSQERPAGDVDPEHPGITVLTGDSFDEIVLQSTKHVLVALTAEWCGPCRMLKPHLYRLARMLEKSEDVVIAIMDVDKNDKDARFFPEKTVPNVKLFVQGSKRTPFSFRGPRTADGLLAFIREHTKIDVDNIVREAYPPFREKGGVAQLQRRMLAALMKERPVSNNRIDYVWIFFFEKN